MGNPAPGDREPVLLRQQMSKTREAEKRMSNYSPARAFGSSVSICVSALRKVSRVSLRSQQEMKSIGRARKTSKENATLTP